MNLYTVLGIFPDKPSAEQAVTKLEQAGFNPKDMSIMTKDHVSSTFNSESTRNENIAKGAISGAATGAIVGGLTGLLVGFGILAIPGLSAYLVGGPIAAALGLTGTVAATISGAATGAVVGGILGALLGLGLPDQETQQQVTEKGVLLAIPAHEEKIADVKELLHQFHAAQIRSFIMDDNAVTAQPQAAPIAEPVKDGELAESTMETDQDDESNISAAQIVDEDDGIDDEEFTDREYNQPPSSGPGLRPAYAYVGVKGGSTRRELSEDLFGKQNESTPSVQPREATTTTQDQVMQDRPIRRIRRDIRF